MAANALGTTISRQANFYPTPKKLFPKRDKLLSTTLACCALPRKILGAAEPEMMQLVFTLESYVTPPVTVIGVGLDANFKI